MKAIDYSKKFSPARFLKKLGKVAGSAGTQVVYAALLLYYAYEREETPAWAKRIVIGTLGYLIVPTDAIPDFSPLVGYTDDLGVLSFTLVTIATYVNDGVREKAREKLAQWIPSVRKSDIEAVEERL